MDTNFNNPTTIKFDLYQIFYHLERIRNYHYEPNWWEHQDSDRMFGRIDQAQAFVRSLLVKLEEDPNELVINAMEHAAWSSYFGRLLTEDEKIKLTEERLNGTQHLIPPEYRK
jgi:hypothetical protein